MTLSLVDHRLALTGYGPCLLDGIRLRKKFIAFHLSLEVNQEGGIHLSTSVLEGHVIKHGFVKGKIQKWNVERLQQCKRDRASTPGCDEGHGENFLEKIRKRECRVMPRVFQTKKGQRSRGKHIELGWCQERSEDGVWHRGCCQEDA